MPDPSAPLNRRRFFRQLLVKSIDQVVSQTEGIAAALQKAVEQNSSVVDAGGPPAPAVELNKIESRPCPPGAVAVGSDAEEGKKREEGAEENGAESGSVSK